MSSLALRRRLTRSRGSLAAVACVLVLSGAVAAHHIEMPADHSGMGMHGLATMVMCLGVVGLVAVALAAAPRLGRPLPRVRRAGSESRPRQAVRRSAAHAAREGPPLFLLFAVVRR